MGPLSGLKIVEVAGIGPAPFAAMMLSDMGADVIRVDRLENSNGGDPAAPPSDIFNRGRRSIALNLKSAGGLKTLLDLIGQADAVMEGFRPGVAERLGFGPEVCQEINPKLVYGRMTGWGQDGPYALTAGHDINYIALAGVLAHLGREGEKPTPPINLVGDFGGGGMLLAFGLVCALLEAGRSGQGQVVDAAMVDGSASLMTMVWGFKAMGMWSDDRGTNLLDTATHFYDTYECADGNFVSIGSIEPQFYAELLKHTNLEQVYVDLGEPMPTQMDKAKWPEMKAHLAAIFVTKSRDEWSALLEGTDICFAPVLTMDEAAQHPHNVHRKTFVEVAGITQPAPSPRFDRTPGEIQRPPSHPGQHTDEILTEWLGAESQEIAELRQSDSVA
ncbi:putative acyl-CoA transferase/carnitine dehydratase [Actinobacteria bacterium IMCC26207]|nr:putative acyl-CoA transferase/carnitine dehydratase [Actinobacteria bacterium IMCC26207]